MYTKQDLLRAYRAFPQTPWSCSFFSSYPFSSSIRRRCRRICIWRRKVRYPMCKRFLLG